MSAEPSYAFQLLHCKGLGTTCAKVERFISRQWSLPHEPLCTCVSQPLLRERAPWVDWGIQVVVQPALMPHKMMSWKGCSAM